MDYFSLLSNKICCIALREDKTVYSSEQKGIKPVLELHDNFGSELSGCIVVDKIIGRAAAFILSSCKIKKLYAKVISKGACEILEQCGIEYEYLECADTIINRQGNGPCPMEQAVEGITDSASAITAVRKRLKELSHKN